MSLENQISLISVPQEFTRLCNAVLFADHGDDFLAIDDDQADRGNDGYLKSEKRVFAAHCFKRVQNQSIEKAIRSKMVGDLGKAIALARDSEWTIEAWTFLSNYQVPEATAETVHRMGQEAGIDVSWRGADHLAAGLQRHPEIRSAFPTLQVNEIAERLEQLEETVGHAASGPAADESETDIVIERSPRTPEEEAALINSKPPGWEYLLFAGALLQERQALELKWHDHELGIGRGPTRSLDKDEAQKTLGQAFGPMTVAIDRLARVLDPEAQERAFGSPGEPGDVLRIKHLASRLVAGYEEMLDLQAELRSYSPPEAYEEVYRLGAQFPDQPLEQIRTFIDDLVEKTDEIPAILAGPEEQRERIVIKLTLAISLREGLDEQFSHALKELEHRLFD
ncbi:MAG TPA: hypothetical protein VLJ42_04930 [Solirubrobacteraceae bacterium]|nr:hypothetical protein [Solirubrobacteraceae bacterium]